MKPSTTKSQTMHPQSEPLFSVVIPAFNAEPYIADCVDSVLCQTEADLEVIVVDDGSTDSTATIVRSYADPRVRLVQRVNGGLATARNTGIAAASGQLIAFLDADDRWLPTKLAHHRAALEADPGAGISYDWSAFIDASGQRTGLSMTQARVEITCDALLLKNYLGNGSTSVVRRSVLETAGGFDEALKRFVDHELWVRLACTGQRFCLIPEVLTEYRIHAASFTADAQRMLKGLEAFLETIAAYNPESVSRLAPLARACTHRWMARAAFVAGDYSGARAHARTALRIAPSVLWRDSSALITFAAIGAQLAMPAPLFSWLLNRTKVRLQVRQASLTASVLLIVLCSLSPIPANAAPGVKAELATSAPIQITIRKNQNAYLLGAGDKIKLTVYGYDDLSGEQMILPDGRINLPLVGALQVANLSVEDATTLVSQRLSPYINRPQVSLAVLSLRALRVNIVGEVNQPGPQVLAQQVTPNSASVSQNIVLTMSRALLAAKGITSRADLSSVELHRRLVDGSIGVSHYDLWSNLMGKTDFIDPVLQDGDTIIVGRLAKNSDQKPSIFLRSSVAVDRISIAVGGEVKSPGEVKVAPNQSVLDAIANAGGPTDAADLSSVTLLRQQDGQMIASVLDLDAARRGNADQNPLLASGDSLIVPRSGWRNFTDNFGRILSPVTSLFYLFDGLFRR
jgi:protein involved in polysaccharide export with SLBB domain/GT2 family glycosyltransferase